MRLRRETGDFQIKLVGDSNGWTGVTIRSGLSAEDLIGEVVTFEFDMNDVESAGKDIIVTACDSLTNAPSYMVVLTPNMLATLIGAAGASLTYNKKTGEIKVYANTDLAALATAEAS